ASVTARALGGGGGGGGMGGGRGNPAAQREALFKDITLTPAQTASIDSIYKISTDKLAELMKDMQAGTPQPPEMREKRMAINTERTAAIKKVLTAEQVVIFDKNTPQGRGRGSF
ncbi:MAG: hypothetical protein H7Z40_21300, partial [Phycisphaerae bacterium]|nr:hypothetical protein [Gemmatimonadaceae bacterium]